MHLNDFSTFVRGFSLLKFIPNMRTYKINLFTLQNISSDSSADFVFNPITWRKEGIGIEISLTVGMTEREDLKRENFDCGGKSSRGWKWGWKEVTRKVLMRETLLDFIISFWKRFASRNLEVSKCRRFKV